MFGGRDGNQRLEWLSRGVNDVNGGCAFKMLPMTGEREGEKLEGWVELQAGTYLSKFTTNDEQERGKAR